VAEAKRKVTRQVRPAGVQLRILLFSDLVLDSPYEWAPPALAEARRTASRDALVELLSAARQYRVDAIACAGDLFDRQAIRPASMQWLIAAFRSAGVPVLIAPGNRDFVGPLGGYTRHEWPDNVTIFETGQLMPVEVTDGVTVWGAGHTEAHLSRSFLDHFQVEGEGVNLALFHGAEKSGAEREPTLDTWAAFDEAAIERAGFAHALVGHYQQPHFGWLHTYPGAPLAHDFGIDPVGGAVLLTLSYDGTIDREYLDIGSPQLQDVEVDLTGSKSKRDVVRRTKSAVGDHTGPIRLRLLGRISPEIVLQREDFLDLVASDDELLLEGNYEVDVDFDELTNEQTVRGQFVRDVLLSTHISDERRQRVLLIGLRALAGSDVLEGPR
jgi:DNA repair exonuclease SbcCD nuclease subunit